MADPEGEQLVAEFIAEVAECRRSHVTASDDGKRLDRFFMALRRLVVGWEALHDTSGFPSGKVELHILNIITSERTHAEKVRSGILSTLRRVKKVTSIQEMLIRSISGLVPTSDWHHFLRSDVTRTCIRVVEKNPCCICTILEMFEDACGETNLALDFSMKVLSSSLKGFATKQVFWVHNFLDLIKGEEDATRVVKALRERLLGLREDDRYDTEYKHLSVDLCIALVRRFSSRSITKDSFLLHYARGMKVWFEQIVEAEEQPAQDGTRALLLPDMLFAQFLVTFWESKEAGERFLRAAIVHDMLPWNDLHLLPSVVDETVEHHRHCGYSFLATMPVRMLSEQGKVAVAIAEKHKSQVILVTCAIFASANLFQRKSLVEKVVVMFMSIEGMNHGASFSFGLQEVLLKTMKKMVAVDPDAFFSQFTTLLDLCRQWTGEPSALLADIVAMTALGRAAGEDENDAVSHVVDTAESLFLEENLMGSALAISLQGHGITTEKLQHLSHFIEGVLLRYSGVLPPLLCVQCLKFLQKQYSCKGNHIPDSMVLLMRRLLADAGVIQRTSFYKENLVSRSWLAFETIPDFFLSGTPKGARQKIVLNLEHFLRSCDVSMLDTLDNHSCWSGYLIDIYLQSCRNQRSRKSGPGWNPEAWLVAPIAFPPLLLDEGTISSIAGKKSVHSFRSLIGELCVDLGSGSSRIVSNDVKNLLDALDEESLNHLKQDIVSQALATRVASALVSSITKHALDEIRKEEPTGFRRGLLRYQVAKLIALGDRYKTLALTASEIRRRERRQRFPKKRRRLRGPQTPGSSVSQSSVSLEIFSDDNFNSDWCLFLKEFLGYLVSDGYDEVLPILEASIDGSSTAVDSIFESVRQCIPLLQLQTGLVTHVRCISTQGVFDLRRILELVRCLLKLLVDFQSHLDSEIHHETQAVIRTLALEYMRLYGLIVFNAKHGFIEYSASGDSGTTSNSVSNPTDSMTNLVGTIPDQMINYEIIELISAIALRGESPNTEIVLQASWSTIKRMYADPSRASANSSTDPMALRELSKKFAHGEASNAAAGMLVNKVEKVLGKKSKNLVEYGILKGSLVRHWALLYIFESKFENHGNLFASILDLLSLESIGPWYDRIAGAREERGTRTEAQPDRLCLPYECRHRFFEMYFALVSLSMHLAKPEVPDLTRCSERERERMSPFQNVENLVDFFERGLVLFVKQNEFLGEQRTRMASTVTTLMIDVGLGKLRECCDWRASLPVVSATEKGKGGEDLSSPVFVKRLIFKLGRLVMYALKNVASDREWDADSDDDYYSPTPRSGRLKEVCKRAGLELNSISISMGLSDKTDEAPSKISANESPYSYAKSNSCTVSRGAVGQRLIEGWCQPDGFNQELSDGTYTPPDSDSVSTDLSLTETGSSSPGGRSTGELP